MKCIETKIEIAAGPARVWQILTDLESYSEWNPFIKKAQGRVHPGEKLEVLILPPDGKPMVFKPGVKSVIEHKEFIWLGRFVLPGIFDGEHMFFLQEKEGKTVFTQKEQFTGLLVPLLWKSMNKKTRKGFELMNKALKARAEQ